MLKKRVTQCLIGVILAASLPLYGKSTVIKNEFMIELKNNVNVTEAKLEKSFEAKILRKIYDSNILLIKLRKTPSESLNQTIVRLGSFSFVATVEPNYRMQLDGFTNDAQVDMLWGLHNEGQKMPNQNDPVSNNNHTWYPIPGGDISLEQAWTLSVGSPRVIVGIVDTGIDYNHEDLKKNVWVNQAEQNGQLGIDDDKNGVIDDIHGFDVFNNDGDPMDDNGHGSHVAGTIGAEANNGVGVAGINQNVSIMAAKTFGAGGNASYADMIDGINYVVKMGAQVINASWGGKEPSDLLKKAVQKAGAKNVVFVSAAGNNYKQNVDKKFYYPASYNLPHQLTVAAVNNEGFLSIFSNIGPKRVHVAAPGETILSTLPGNKYEAWDGTSMATPHVVGVVALLRAKEPNLKATEIKQRIMKTAQPRFKVKDFVASGGIVNAYYALANQTPPPDDFDPNTWAYDNIDWQTDHPFKTGETHTWEYHVPGATWMALYIPKMEGALLDVINVYDRDGWTAENVGDTKENYWVVPIKSDYVKVVYKTTTRNSDSDRTDKERFWGLQISKIAYRKN